MDREINKLISADDLAKKVICRLRKKKELLKLYVNVRARYRICTAFDSTEIRSDLYQPCWHVRRFKSSMYSWIYVCANAQVSCTIPDKLPHQAALFIFALLIRVINQSLNFLDSICSLHISLLHRGDLNVSCPKAKVHVLYRPLQLSDPSIVSVFKIYSICN